MHNCILEVIFLRSIGILIGKGYQEQIFMCSKDLGPIPSCTRFYLKKQKVFSEISV